MVTDQSAWMQYMAQTASTFTPLSIYALLSWMSNTTVILLAITSYYVPKNCTEIIHPTFLNKHVLTEITGFYQSHPPPFS